MYTCRIDIRIGGYNTILLRGLFTKSEQVGHG